MLISELFESYDTFERDTAVAYIREHCSDILNVYQRLGAVLYRGISYYVGTSWAVEESRVDRSPKDTAPRIQKLVDQKLEGAGFKALRSNSTFTNPMPTAVLEYGTSYVIYPENGFDFTWSPVITDFWAEIIDIPVRYSHLERCLEELTPAEFVNEYNFLHGSLDSAINSKNEILIRGKYVLIKNNLFSDAVRDELGIYYTKYPRNED